MICGRGIAVMSSMLIKRELAAGEVCMLDLEGMPMRRALNLIYHKDKFITPAIANIIDVCKRYRAAVGERSAVSPPEEGGCV